VKSSIASLVRKLAGNVVGKEEHVFAIQKCKLANPLPVKKLTIEIEGKGALSPRTRIFADGKQLPFIQHFSMDASVNSPCVDINMVQSTLVMKEKRSGYEPEIIGQPIEINWVKD